MKTKLTLVLGLTFAFTLLILPGIASADVFLKQKQHTDGVEMMGHTQPEKDLITTVWITEDKACSDNEEQSTIIRLDKGITYLLDHKKKTYMILNVDLSKVSSSTNSEVDKEEIEQFQSMMNHMMRLEISIKPTGEKQKIGKWNCEKYTQKVVTGMGSMNTEIWATDQIRINHDVYTKFAAAMFASVPGMQNMVDSITREMQKVKGVSVLTKTTSELMGQTITSSTELLEAKEGKAPAGIFDLPSGYKKVEMRRRGMHD